MSAVTKTVDRHIREMQGTFRAGMVDPKLERIARGILIKPPPLGQGEGVVRIRKEANQGLDPLMSIGQLTAAERGSTLLSSLASGGAGEGSFPGAGGKPRPV